MMLYFYGNHYSKMESKEVIEKVIKEFDSNPLNIDDIGNYKNDKNYIEIMKGSYLKTLEKCKELMPNKDSTICELGSFFGILAKSLRYSGYKVNACDIPFFYDRDSVKKHYAPSGVNSFSFNLRDYILPFENSSQDLLIACEIFEHLNFNPLPMIKEINRIIKLGGYLYIAMPNAASFVKRIRFLLFGKQPNFTPKQLFEQLDENNNMVVGLHWREYTANEVRQMVEPFGFKMVYKKFDSNVDFLSSKFFNSLIKKIIFSIPGCKPNQIIIFKKIKTTNIHLTINKDS